LLAVERPHHNVPLPNRHIDNEFTSFEQKIHLTKVIYWFYDIKTVSLGLKSVKRLNLLKSFSTFLSSQAQNWYSALIAYQINFINLISVTNDSSKEKHL